MLYACTYANTNSYAPSFNADSDSTSANANADPASSNADTNCAPTETDSYAYTGSYSCSDANGDPNSHRHA